jgi:hypothetical protein
MVHECDGGKEEISRDGWSARFFKKIGEHISSDSGGSELTGEDLIRWWKMTLSNWEGFRGRMDWSCVPVSRSERVSAKKPRLSLVWWKARPWEVESSTRESDFGVRGSS